MLILMITFSSFNFVALLHSLLANDSTPQAGGGALWRPWCDGGCHGSLCFDDQRA
jgi:hypothetical protein